MGTLTPTVDQLSIVWQFVPIARRPKKQYVSGEFLMRDQTTVSRMNCKIIRWPVVFAFCLLSLTSCNQKAATPAPGEIENHYQVFNTLPNFLSEQHARHIEYIEKRPDFHLDGEENPDSAVSELNRRISGIQECRHGIMNVRRHWKYEWPVATDEKKRFAECIVLIEYSPPMKPHDVTFEYVPSEENRLFCKHFESVIRETYSPQELTIHHKNLDRMPFEQD